jgi:hypothetical protein
MDWIVKFQRLILLTKMDANLMIFYVKLRLEDVYWTILSAWK